MRLGSSKVYTEKARVSWREWNKREGSFLLLCVFGPGKFPGWTIVFATDTEHVKKAIDEEIGRELLKKYRGFDRDLFVKISRDGDEWFLDLEEGQTSGYVYNLEGRNLIRRKEDIPF